MIDSIIVNVILIWIISAPDALQNYRSAMEKLHKTKDELQELVNNLRTPEMQAKYQECKEAEEQLKETEKKLGAWHLILLTVIIVVEQLRIIVPAPYLIMPPTNKFGGGGLYWNGHVHLLVRSSIGPLRILSGI